MGYDRKRAEKPGPKRHLKPAASALASMAVSAETSSTHFSFYPAADLRAAPTTAAPR
jgi:hypothetical protein